MSSWNLTGPKMSQQMINGSVRSASGRSRTAENAKGTSYHSHRRSSPRCWSKSGAHDEDSLRSHVLPFWPRLGSASFACLDGTARETGFAFRLRFVLISLTTRICILSQMGFRRLHHNRIRDFGPDEPQEP